MLNCITKLYTYIHRNTFVFKKMAIRLTNIIRTKTNQSLAEELVCSSNTMPEYVDDL